MEYVNRLIACGFSEAEAEEIYFRYAALQDWGGLEKYVRAIELYYDDRKEFPSGR